KVTGTRGMRRRMHAAARGSAACHARPVKHPAPLRLRNVSGPQALPPFQQERDMKASDSIVPARRAFLGNAGKATLSVAAIALLAGNDALAQGASTGMQDV